MNNPIKMIIKVGECIMKILNGDKWIICLIDWMKIWSKDRMWIYWSRLEDIDKNWR
jgi:hypothetical protein